MSTPPISSTPHSSLTPARETTVQELSRRISEAIEKTRTGIDDDLAAYLHCFLPKNDLAAILSQKSLQRLFKELLSNFEATVPATARINVRDGLVARNGVPHADLDDLVESYVERTVGDPSRVALLALFLYEQHMKLICLFMDWLRLSLTDFPSDDEMPFTKTLIENVFPRECRLYIIRNQNIFKPVVIKEGNHQQTFQSWDRLPFIGAPLPIQDGSFGAVFKTKIAPGHWQIKSHGAYVPGNPHGPVVMVLKSFKQIPGWRSSRDATNDFNKECDILDELRRCKVKHDAIMLDWSRITIHDEASNPTSHSLIFELATCSLAGFLRDESRASAYPQKSVLLARLVDIVEALACLHDTLKTLHLDIKPDNILVFENGSSRSEHQNEDGNPMIWKLSDFGLARKNKSRPKTVFDSSYHASHSSTLDATRPAGMYQAPEIQVEDSSQAGRRSDVWSIGCVTLMVLAFVTDGDTEVISLESHLSVVFKKWGGKQRCFYVRSDTYQWDFKASHRFSYLQDFNPIPGNIPGTERPLQAVVHPQLVTWSTILHDSYDRPYKQKLVREILDVVFRHVLLIDRAQRIKAAEFGQRLARVQEQWRSYEEQPNSTAHVTGGAVLQNVAQQSLEPSNTIPSSILDEEEEERGSLARFMTRDLLPERGYNLQTDQQSPERTPPADGHSALCWGIKSRNADAVRRELGRDTEQLKHPCGHCNVYPIHKALRNKAYKALEILLKDPGCDQSVTSLCCAESGGQTAIQFASEGSGDSKALRYFLMYRAKFDIDKGLYKERKGSLSTESRKVLGALCK